MSDADFLQNRWPHLKREEKRKTIENIVISKEEFPSSSLTFLLARYNKKDMEPRGFEPLTSSMPLRRSTN